MLSAWTVGVAESGRDALASASWIAAVVSGTLLPNANWVTTSEIELDDVDWISSRRGIAPMARSIGRVTCSSDVRGSGAGVRRDHGHDRELDVGEELLLEAAPGRDAGDEQGRREQERHAPLADGQTAEATHDWLSRVIGGGDGSIDGEAEDVDRAADHLELLGVEPAEQLAQLALIELAEPLEQGDGLGRRGDHHLAPVVGVVVATEQAELDQPIGQPARRRRADPQPGSQLGHAQLAGGHARRTGPWPGPWSRRPR